jgi:hypothetical protein
VSMRRLHVLTPAAISAALFAVAGMCVFLPIASAHAATTLTKKIIYLTSGTTWTVPADWNSTNNTIEAIGGGGGGAYGDSNFSGPGGGAGAYSKAVNQGLTARRT